MSIGASGNKSKSKSTSIDLTPKQYKRQRQLVADEYVGRIGGKVAGLEGPFVAELTQSENEALGAFQQNAFGGGGLGEAADQQLLDTLQGKTNPFVPQAIDAAINPILRNAELQELRDRALFTGAGQKIQGSSSFSEDRARSIADTERNVGDVASQVAFQAYQQERQNQIQAVSLANQRFAEQREGIATLALPRLIEQLGIDRGNEEMLRRFSIIENALQSLAQLTQPTVGTKSTSSSEGGSAQVGYGSGGGTGE